MCNCWALGSVQHSSHHCFQITLLCGIYETHIARSGENGEIAMCGKVAPQVLLVMQHHVCAQHGAALVILGWMHQLRALCERPAAPNPAAGTPSSQQQVGAERRLHMGVHKAGVASRTFDLSTGGTLSLLFIICFYPLPTPHAAFKSAVLGACLVPFLVDGKQASTLSTEFHELDTNR